ncbi:conserved hypothetical protein [Ricinus communis]|uniref:Uncharacterized protein n=1 Tax=Ricinus communis TaxID=3988 RepID=B9SJ88_RICCO|nr:conserved hypothetical protein [Ricinus communis]
MTSCYRRLDTGVTGPVHSQQQRPRRLEIVSLPVNRNLTTNQRLGIFLRSPKHSKSSFLIEAVLGRSEGGNEAEKVGRYSYSVGDQTVGEVDGIEKNHKLEVAVAASATVVLGVGNRVLYKLALVPLKHYPFFLAQLATFGYVIVYFTILYIRYHAGIVTDEMLSMPKAPYLLVGLLEALAAATGMAAAAILSGASIPILSQEIIFLDAAKRLKGGSVDIFVVNSYGSAFQALFICLLLPFMSKLWGVPFGQLPSYLKDGAVCFLNMGGLSSEEADVRSGR